MLLQWGTAYAPAVYVDVAGAEPGIFQTGQQGIITDASGNLIGPSNPAHAGDVVIIYCTGLGAVTPSIADGQPTPSAYYTVQNPVTVTMGGQNANVQFAGLTPVFNGLYQINVMVPQGIAAGGHCCSERHGGGADQRFRRRDPLGLRFRSDHDLD